MSRKKEGSIQESPEELRTLLRIHSGSHREPRLQMLLFLRDHPVLTIREIAAQMECSERTARRWWKSYQQGGLQGLLGGDNDQIPQSPSHRTARVNSIVSPPLMKFLNKLPVTDDTIEWISQFREGLQRLLGDVDRVTVSVETECDLYSPDGSEMEFILTQHIPDARSRRRAAEVTTQRLDRPPRELLLENLRRRAFPLDHYHLPHAFDYHVANGAYLGTIVLWRDKHAPDISERTLLLMSELEPFLTFLLSDCAERRRQERPDIYLLSTIIDSVSRPDALTRREREVLLCLLLGRGHSEIEQQLSITMHTLRRHVNVILRKSGVKTFGELFARYFTRPGN